MAASGVICVPLPTTRRWRPTCASVSASSATAANPGQPPGREALKQIFGGFSVLVPDLRITVEDVIADGDKAAVRSTVTGTPAGPYLGADPAGRPMRFEAIDIWRIQDGQVAEGWHVEDFVATLAAWGAVTFASRPRDAAPPPSAEAAMDPPGDPLGAVRRWYQALRSTQTGAIGTLLDDRFVNHGPIGAGVPMSSGRDGLGGDVISLHRAFPDIDVIVADMFAEHDKLPGAPTSARSLTSRRPAGGPR